ncbi:hypothetical protein [Parvimonas parva]|uniref:Flagellar export protein FliJ n=1 Tax=Parvimonas parva TaxID=2769485 RepID=A0ABS1CAR3_9FIRM|nr:hypothetical protein [Parvimonas parva]MBK1469214.1 hypothetical protein [Parvimonas parva]
MAKLKTDDLINKKLIKIEKEIEIKQKKIKEESEAIELLKSEKTEILVNFLLEKDLSLSKILEMIKNLDEKENFYEN